MRTSSRAGSVHPAWAAFLGVALLFTITARAHAQSCPDQAAKVVSIQGTVEAKRSGATDWQTVRLEDVLCPGDTIRVRPKSRADVALADQSVLRLREGSEMVLEGVTEERSYVLDLLQGAAHIFSRQGAGNLDVKTPFTVAGVRGTEFAVDVTADNTVVRVFEGKVLAANDAGSLALTDGQSAVAQEGAAPVLRVEARPRDAVRWALYYPPALWVGPGDTAAKAGWQRNVAESAEAQRAGDLSRAFALVNEVPDEQVSDPRFFTHRASLALAVGSVDAAAADLDRALTLSTDDSEALALRSIIAVAQNDKEGALEAARRAVAADPTSATARIALSYAEQAHFDLEGARASVEEAVRLDSGNALAWARLAELHSSFGDVDRALAAAKKAEAIDPSLSRTQTVLGFARLTNVEPEQALSAFDKAIAADSADPLPRLGKGLAKIRDGDLEGGARDIEIAASLDPNNALIRSYLGKAYFEEKREGLDEREYATAKTLDPNDPTPWFYDAIAKQTTNRPVEALHDLQQAIELNDNRAVYRSRLLLDADLASRSASLGRIYGDLGFQNLALVEGWKSLNTDPSNYSAHRLLADSYASQPRHELARVSELLQSQLLQPTNITPIQPRLGESNLFLVSAQGPANQSFTEFNPLFNRDRVAVQTSGLVGEDETWSGEGIVSGIQGRGSFSAGYSYFTTDGFRTNNTQDDHIANIFGQYELSAKTSVQAEGRYRDLDNGDLELRFLEDDFSEFSDESTEAYSARAGLRHALSPNSIVLASYIHAYSDTDFDDFFPDPVFGDASFGLDLDETGDTVEAQYIYRSPSLGWGRGLVRNINVTTGLGQANVDVDEASTFALAGVPPCVPAPGDPFCPVREPDVSHTNVHAYSYIGLGDDVTVTLGASGDFFEEDDDTGGSDLGTRNRGNPKVGLTWSPSFLSGTTLRGAAFRALTRTLITGQTLEPTQVAGFNQFFDDPHGTDAWRYGGAIDQKFSDSVFGGLEYSKRDLDVPQILLGAGTPVVETNDWDEHLGRAYVFWTPHEWVSARLEYQYEHMKRAEESLFAFKKVTTHRVPLGVQFFHPCGASLSFGATYLNQDGTFFNPNAADPLGSDLFISGDRDFWVLDAGIRYRLPRRYGFVALGVNNFLDEDSSYQATDVRNPNIRPERFVFASVTLALP